MSREELSTYGRVLEKQHEIAPEGGTTGEGGRILEVQMAKVTLRAFVATT